MVLIEPAGSTTLPGLHNLKVPAGDLKIFDASFDAGGAELIKPDIEMLSYMSSLPGKPLEQSLVYFPIWKVDYVFNQKRYEVVLDGSSGEVFAAEFPPRSSGAYIVVAAVGFFAFVAEGLVATASIPLAAILMGVTVAGVFMAALCTSQGGCDMTGISVGLTCPACGGVVSTAEGEDVVACPYCSSTLFIEGDKGVTTIAFRSKLSRDHAVNTTAQWWARGWKARDLRTAGRITEVYPIYLPFWRANTRAAGWVCGYEERRHTDQKGNVRVEKIPRRSWSCRTTSSRR